MNRWPIVIRDIETSTPRSEEHWLDYDVMRRQKNWPGMTWYGCSAEEVMKWDICWIGIPVGVTRDNLWDETQTMRFEDYEDAQSLFLQLVLAWFFFGRNKILAATGNTYQLDLVEQAMKIQFLDDEIRNHDDRTGKYHNNSLGGAVDEDEDQTTRDPEVTESWRDDLDGWGGAIWKRWTQLKKKKKKLKLS